MKNKIKTLGIIAVAAVMALSLLGCEDETLNDPDPITRNLTITGIDNSNYNVNIRFSVAVYQDSGLSSRVAYGSGAYNSTSKSVDAEVKDTPSGGKNHWTGNGSYYVTIRPNGLGTDGKFVDTTILGYSTDGSNLATYTFTSGTNSVEFSKFVIEVDD